MKQWEVRTRSTELRKGTRKNIHGLAVVIHRTDAASARARLDKVRAALDVIARHDPPSLEAMRTHFSAILVWDWMVAANGSYLHSERLCTLYCDYVANTEPARIAMTLVHELAHARHSSRAHRRQPMSWAHAEWLCIGAELAFIKKVPGTEHLRQAAERRLERRPEFYSRTADLERRFAHLEAICGRRCAAFFRYLYHRQEKAGHRE